MMSLNILELIKKQLSPELVSQVSTHLGESESGISKAIATLLPTVLGGLANNAGKPAILDSILGASSGDLLGNLTGDSQNSTISTMLPALFGDKLSSISNTVSSLSGVSESSATSLLNMVTSATVGTLGKFAFENNLGSSGLSNLLSDQKGIVSSLLPAGLSLASFGFGNLGHSEEVVSPIPENVKVTSFDEPKIDVTRGGETHVNVEPDNNDGGGSIWKWLLPLVLLLVAAWFIWNQYKKSHSTTTTNTTDSTMMKSDSTATTPMMKDSTTMNAPKTDTDINLNGKVIKGYAGGMEASMISFLKSGGYKNAENDAALKGIWYNFDKVIFEVGSANGLKEGSQEQLDNLVAILKAYPEAKIKVGGYTDKSGDETKNLALSQARADYIKNALTKAGVGSQVLEAKGYGSSQAIVAPNASNDERAVDRKLAVRFTK